MLNKCTACGSKLSSRVIPKFDAATEIGSPFPVVLYDVVEDRVCEDCKRFHSIVIPNLGDLIAAAAVSRAADPIKLSGEDIRFLRKSLGLKAKEFAEEINVTPATLSRFENDKQTVSDAPEHQIRNQVFLGHLETTYALGFRKDEFRAASAFRGPRSLDDSVVVELTIVPAEELERVVKARNKRSEEVSWQLRSAM